MRAELKCPHPEVPREQRPCWTCGKTGHSNADCPVRKASKGGGKADRDRRAVKAIEDMELPAFNVEDEWQTKKRRAGRPSPQGAKLLDFLTGEQKTKVSNSFAELGSVNSIVDESYVPEPVAPRRRRRQALGLTKAFGECAGCDDPTCAGEDGVTKPSKSTRPLLRTPEVKLFETMDVHFPELAKRMHEGINEVNAVLRQEEEVEEAQRALSVARIQTRASDGLTPKDNEARVAAPAPCHVPTTSMASSSKTRDVKISETMGCPFAAAEARARAAYDRAHPGYDADRAQAIADEDRDATDPLMIQKRHDQARHGEKEAFKEPLAEWVNENKQSESVAFNVPPQ